MDRAETKLHEAALTRAMQSVQRERGPDRFLRALHLAADASRAYRRAAADWRDCGCDEWADQLEQAADAHDADWTERLNAWRRR